MKKYIITISCAFIAQIINTFAGPLYSSWEEIGRDNARERQIDAIYNNAGRSRYESLSYPTY